jgi:hypothetical protein
VPWVAGKPCLEQAGFLIKRRCSRPSAQACTVCQKNVCEIHTRRPDQVVMCIGCARTAARGYYDDDPYFYSTSYYDYGNYSAWHSPGSALPSVADPDDFTEGDAVALTQADGGQTFEDDLDAS